MSMVTLAAIKQPRRMRYRRGGDLARDRPPNLRAGRGNRIAMTRPARNDQGGGYRRRVRVFMLSQRVCVILVGRIYHAAMAHKPSHWSASLWYKARRWATASDPSSPQRMPPRHIR